MSFASVPNACSWFGVHTVLTQMPTAGVYRVHNFRVSDVHSPTLCLSSGGVKEKLVCEEGVCKLIPLEPPAEVRQSGRVIGWLH